MTRNTQQKIVFTLLILLLSCLFASCDGCNGKKAKSWLKKGQQTAKTLLKKGKNAKKWIDKELQKAQREKKLREAIRKGDKKQLARLLKDHKLDAPVSMKWSISSLLKGLRQGGNPTQLLKAFLKYRQLKMAMLHPVFLCKDGDKKVGKKLKAMWERFRKKPSLLLKRSTYKALKGPTALHLSALFCQTGITKLLLERKANPNAKDFQGFTPLHYSTCQATTEILLKHKADVHGTSNVGLTALHLALTRTVAKTLIRHGANTNARDKCGNTPLHISVSLGYSTPPSASVEPVKTMKPTKQVAQKRKVSTKPDSSNPKISQKKNAGSPVMRWLVKNFLHLGAKLEKIMKQLEHDLNIAGVLLKHKANPKTLNDAGKSYEILFLEVSRSSDWDD